MFLMRMCFVFLLTANQNPLLNEWDMKTRDLYTHVPATDVPSLLELSARTVAKNHIKWKSDDLPAVLNGKLSLEFFLQ